MCEVYPEYDIDKDYPHKQVDIVDYAYVLGYRTYYDCFKWCMTNTRYFHGSSGDPDNHIYRFEFFDRGDYLNFLLVLGDQVIHTRLASKPLKLTIDIRKNPL